MTVFCWCCVLKVGVPSQGRDRDTECSRAALHLLPCTGLAAASSLKKDTPEMQKFSVLPFLLSLSKEAEWR